MKIAIISGNDPHYLRDVNGSTVILTNLAKNYSKSGHNVDIFTPLGLSGHHYVPDKTNAQMKFPDILYRNVSVIRFPVSHTADKPSYSSNDQKFARRLEKARSEAAYFDNQLLRNYDLVLIMHMMHAIGIVERENSALDKTVVMPLFVGKFYSNYSEVPPWHIELEAQILRQLKHIHTISRAESDVIVSDYGVPTNSVFIVPAGYDNEVFKPNPRRNIVKNSAINVFHANRIAVRKGQTHFLSIVGEAKSRNLDLAVHFVGLDSHVYNAEANDCARELVRMVSKAGLKDNFIFYDLLPHQEMAQVMSQCQVSIYPSVSETFGLSALESTATGLPTIVFNDVPAFRDFIKHRETGLVVPRDALAVVDQLGELVADSNLYSHISNEGIQSSRQFTWKSIMEILISTYKERGLIK